MTPIDKAPPLKQGKCTECGARVPAPFKQCDEMFMSIHAYRLSLNEKFVYLRELLVDAYSLQHQKRYGKSGKSYAGHLMRLCCGVEFGGPPKMYDAIQNWLNGREEGIGITRPPDLEFRGKLTIRNAQDAKNDEEMEQRIQEWAKDVWDAYEPQHEIARNWIEEAMKSSKGGC
jgi:hypothetical protein